ncbi:hypothetical protein [Microbacterium sp. zg.Y1084]|uniref:hypothetical protein n=1 Tax=Microbacterium sp. zg.Y1084 TaxID=2969667 RepID=UPI00214B2B12|nr:hypothetical protein [Microbacterium sp. zg.Y1084]MCR2813044.1 hypothetical protein [Microbacterium sp. zg.Y1084]
MLGDPFMRQPSRSQLAGELDLFRVALGQRLRHPYGLVGRRAQRSAENGEIYLYEGAVAQIEMWDAGSLEIWHTPYSDPMGKKNEAYVLRLCDEVLGSPGRREHTFDWLRGDPSPKTGNRKPLPVDAYWPRLKLVVEFHEKQHSEAVKHFDKPDVMTVSGVHRGEQRRIYDDRRRELIPAHGLSLVILPMSDFSVRGGLIVPDHAANLEVVRKALAAFV